MVYSDKESVCICLSPQNLTMYDLSNSRLTFVIQEASKEDNIQSVTWILFTDVVQVQEVE